MYDRDATRTSMGALVELCRALRQYKDEMVLAGGWAPCFLTQGYFDHCGSLDIDLVLRPNIVERYERIREIVERLGYNPTENAFRFERQIASPKTRNVWRVEVDFITEPQAAEKLPREWLLSIQRDLKACIILGSSIVFKHNREFTFSAIMPGDGEASTTLLCANVVSSLTMKGQALYRMKDKDSYDIYAVAGFHKGGPRESSAEFMRSIKSMGQAEKVVLDGLQEIRNAFASTTSQGPAAVARFIGSEDARVDSYQRLEAFLANIGWGG